jgi:transcriptional regulator with XRE-family HTH domain
VLTQHVFNLQQMKTVGERIRQAREYRGFSAELLATRVGYKTQSGISNLENRATGRGGFALPRIAEELNIALEWFLQGPDTHDMRSVPPYRPALQPSTSVLSENRTARESAPAEYDPKSKAHQLIDMLSEKGLVHALEMLEALAERHPANQTERAGVHVRASRRNIA